MIDKEAPGPAPPRPFPPGLWAFAVTTALLQSAATGLASKDGGMGLTAGFALGYGGLVQLLVGMWEVVRNNVFGAAGQIMPATASDTFKTPVS